MELLEKQEIVAFLKSQYHMNASHVSKMSDPTINQLYKFEANEKPYILKLYTIDNINQVQRSAEAQNAVCQYERLSPAIVRDKNNSLAAQFCKCPCIVQEFWDQHPSRFDEVEKFCESILLLEKALSTLNRDRFSAGDEYLTRLQLEERLNLNSKQAQVSQNETLICLVDLRQKTILEMPELFECRKRYQIVHRDIRPSNVLNTSEGYKYIDFDFVQVDDLCFELGSAALLFSENNPQKLRTIISKLSSMFGLSQGLLLSNTLKYYVDNSFPLKNVGKLNDEVITAMALSRIQLIQKLSDELKFHFEAIPEVRRLSPDTV